MMTKSMEFLRGILIKDQGVIKITPSFVLKDFDSLLELIANIERVIKLFPQLGGNKGYINDSKINIPLVEFVIQEIMIDKKDTKYTKDNHQNSNTTIYSILMNKIVYYMLMVLMLTLVYKIEDWIKSNEHCIAIKYTEKSSLPPFSDIVEDIKTLKRSIIRMLHPIINKKLSNRGISVTLNAYSGYDAEFTLLNEEKHLNKVLSMQLSVNAGLYVRVPIINVKPLRSIDLCMNIKKLWGIEKNLITVGLSSMDRLICEIRDLLYKSNDELIKNLTIKLSEDPTVRKSIVKGDWVFSFPKSEVKNYIKYFDEVKHFSSTDLITQCEKMINDDHKSSLIKVIEILDELTENPEIKMSNKMVQSIESSINKHSSRITYRYKNSVLSITISRILYLIVHLSYADLPLLSDFHQLKEELDMVSKSFVTRSKPLLIGNLPIKLHIRDTTLLAPGINTPLAEIGNLYGPEYKKVDIGTYRKDKMEYLLKEDKALFERYAMQDAIITLKHGIEMEEFNFTLGKLGVPLTISGIGKTFALQYWSSIKYEGYQVINNVKIGDLGSLITPKNTRTVDIANYIVPYVTAYRGGRNESFMYGHSNIEHQNKTWYDYDLTSAYTTVMSILGHPCIEKAGRIYDKTVKEMTSDMLLLNYIVLDVEFKFPSNTKYPCIPARVDDTIEIYPLEGRSTITGAEYLVAKSMGCRLLVKSGVMIPFDLNKKVSTNVSKDIPVKVEDISVKVEDFIESAQGVDGLIESTTPPIVKLDDIIDSTSKPSSKDILSDGNNTSSTPDDNTSSTPDDSEIRKEELSRLNYMSPFRGIMLELQTKRRTYPKGSFNNLIYKLIGNSIYGQVAMGLSGNRNYDIKTKSYVKVDAGELTNPILASYITGFTRAAIGELMHNVSLLKGNIVSVTTDGFITDVEDLEQKIMEDPKLIKSCLQLYRDLREILTTVRDESGTVKYDNRALEVKWEEDIGLTSWKTRGQKGSTHPGIKALTGFQTKNFESDYVNDMISGMVTDSSKCKKVEFIESGLRTPSTIYKEGGHTMLVYRDKSYSFEYDNKRRIVENQQNDGMLDSVPWRTVEDYRKIRELKVTVSTAPFKEGMFIPTGSTKKYKIMLETSVRSFIKASLSDTQRYGIPEGYFSTYDSIIKFIHGHDPAKCIKLSKSSISHLKKRETISRAVPRTPENEEFIKYVCQHIKSFDSDLFFRELSKEARKLSKLQKPYKKALESLKKMNKILIKMDNLIKM